MPPSPDPDLATTRPQALDLPLRLLVKGFNPMERRLLDGTVTLSQRRAPRLELVDDAEAASADVVMIDARDADAMHWARRHVWLARKPVIWVDAATAPGGHTKTRRPVPWPTLPLLLAQAIEASPRRSSYPRVPGSDAIAAGIAPPLRPVLVAVRDATERALLASLLQARGICLTLAGNAHAALQAGAAMHYGCVLMDVLLPDLDGYEACRRLKAGGAGSDAERRRTSIVLLSDDTAPFDRVRGRMAGCDAHLAKPVDPTALMQVLMPLVTVAAVVPATAPAARTPLPRLAS